MIYILIVYLLKYHIILQSLVFVIYSEFIELSNISIKKDFQYSLSKLWYTHFTVTPHPSSHIINQIDHKNTQTAQNISHQIIAQAISHTTAQITNISHKNS